jgi:hypothetical protein
MKHQKVVSSIIPSHIDIDDIDDIDDPCWYPGSSSILGYFRTPNESVP